jgi:hypothetical protein
MELHDLIVPAGIVTYVVLWLSLLSGAQKIRVGFKWHRRLGVIGVVCASIHAGLVVFHQF